MANLEFKLMQLNLDFLMGPITVLIKVLVQKKDWTLSPLQQFVIKKGLIFWLFLKVS